jgi:hypothetical protein
MFFRRETPKIPTFSERLEQLRQAGFTVAAEGAVTRVSRDGCAVDLREGSEIGALVDGGYQKFFRTPAGQQKPATAVELKALHAFEEDLHETLGQQNYYNEALGTVSTFYLYDRVKDRDQGVPKRVWES